MSGKEAAGKSARLEARPERTEIDLAKTALIIVDMQNVFVGRGTSPSPSGQDMTPAMDAIEQARRLVNAARAAAVRVVYLTMIKDPERKGRGIIKGPQDTKIVDELSPLPEDTVIEKTWYSGFRGTMLDNLLKSSGISYLIFTGIATNVCVESTLRDAYFLDYWPILVSDATSNAGPSVTQQATEWNVEQAFGWVATTESVLKALSGEWTDPSRPTAVKEAKDLKTESPTPSAHPPRR